MNAYLTIIDDFRRSAIFPIKHDNHDGLSLLQSDKIFRKKQYLTHSFSILAIVLFYSPPSPLLPVLTDQLGSGGSFCETDWKNYMLRLIRELIAIFYEQCASTET